MTVDEIRGLSGRDLDWAVAEAMGWRTCTVVGVSGQTWSEFRPPGHQGEDGSPVGPEEFFPVPDYSKEWSLAGPLLERTVALRIELARIHLRIGEALSVAFRRAYEPLTPALVCQAFLMALEEAKA